MEHVFVREVALRYRGPKRTAVQPLREPTYVAAYCRKLLVDNIREHFFAVYLDNRFRPIGHSLVALGSANEALVHPREILQPALQLGAIALVVAHNHPSGDPTPSAPDIALTRRLDSACALIGIRLLDHVVFTDAGHQSMTKHLTAECGDHRIRAEG